MAGRWWTDERRRAQHTCTAGRTSSRRWETSRTAAYSTQLRRASFGSTCRGAEMKRSPPEGETLTTQSNAPRRLRNARARTGAAGSKGQASSAAIRPCSRAQAALIRAVAGQRLVAAPQHLLLFWCVSLTCTLLAYQSDRSYRRTPPAVLL
jgi:hypothetical protein